MLLITLLDDNEAKPPITVAYLRKYHICNIIIRLWIFNIEHVQPHFYIFLMTTETLENGRMWLEDVVYEVQFYHFKLLTIY
jgi:hypothetical protein